MTQQISNLEQDTNLSHKKKPPLGRSLFRSYNVNQLYKLHRQDHQITDQNFYLVVQVVAQLKSLLLNLVSRVEILE